MTHQEFTDKWVNINHSIHELQVELKNLERDYVEENMPYPIGTKVKVTRNGSVFYGIVTGAELDVVNQVSPIIMRMKKDGTPSKNTKIWFWGFEDIEAIE
jgi:hypothetical protein